MIQIPDDMRTRAEWWCATNGYVAPAEHPELTAAECQELFDALDRLPGVADAGIALCRERYDRGLYSHTGTPLPESVLAERKR